MNNIDKIGNVCVFCGAATVPSFELCGSPIQGRRPRFFMTCIECGYRSPNVPFSKELINRQALIDAVNKYIEDCDYDYNYSMYADDDEEEEKDESEE